jgi:hypothetical protein
MFSLFNTNTSDTAVTLLVAGRWWLAGEQRKVHTQ